MEHRASEHKQSQMRMTVKIEEQGPATSAVYIDSKIDLNHLKQEPGLVQSAKSEPTMLVKKEIAENSNEAATMEHGASQNIKEQFQTEMTIKTVTVHTDSGINPNSWNPEPVLVHSAISGPALFVKEEILEDSSHGSSEQQCVDDTATPVGTGGVNETCSTSLDDLHNVKYESADIDIGPNVLQHMDIHYTINKNVGAATEENSIGDDCNEAMPGSGVKKGSTEDKWGDSLTSQNAIMKERSVREHQLASDCRVHVMTLNVFQCDICHAVYTDKLGLLQHLHSMHVCRPRTSLVAEVRKTNKRTAAGNISSCFRCTACGKTFRKPHLLNAHRKLHERHSASSSSVAGPSNMRRSEAEKTEPQPFKCDLCEKRYSSKATLSEHKCFYSGVGLSVCHICGAKFNLDSELTIYLRTHTGEQPYQCDTCNARFAQNTRIITHKRDYTGEKPYKCNTCNARFTTSGQLTTHKRIHTGEKPYQCNTCNARFTTSGQLTTHKRVHTGEKPYHCDTCSARFTTSGQLTRHKRVHTGERPFQCDICHAGFAGSGNLTNHKRFHTGEKPYQCDTCKARFAASSCLTRHKRVHAGKKPYQCDTCHARFTDSGNLNKHKRVHTGEKPYQCDTCNARFSESGSLTQHKRVHTGEKPFECTECDSKFSQRSSLNKHVRTRHPK